MDQFFGIGIDVVEIDRIERALARHPRLEARLFTPAESRYCRSRTHPARHFAARFAAKEAALKALGTGIRGVRWVDVEVSRGELGQPLIALSRGAAGLAEELGVTRLCASLSLGRDSAVAAVVALRS